MTAIVHKIINDKDEIEALAGKGFKIEYHWNGTIVYSDIDLRASSEEVNEELSDLEKTLPGAMVYLPPAERLRCNGEISGWIVESSKVGARLLRSEEIADVPLLGFYGHGLRRDILKSLGVDESEIKLNPVEVKGYCVVFNRAPFAGKYGNSQILRQRFAAPNFVQSKGKAQLMVVDLEGAVNSLKYLALDSLLPFTYVRLPKDEIMGEINRDVWVRQLPLIENFNGWYEVMLPQKNARIPEEYWKRLYALSMVDHNFVDAILANARGPRGLSLWNSGFERFMDRILLEINPGLRRLMPYLDVMT